MRGNILLITLGLLGLATAEAQSPSGMIAGAVSDQTGAVVSAAQIVVISKDTALRRVVETSSSGQYSVPTMPSGTYEVEASAKGFRRLARDAIIEAGGTTQVDFTMQLGAASDSVVVNGATPQIHYDAHDIAAVVTRDRIQSLPLNGRSFLELSKLEPGGQPPTRASDNRTLVPFLGPPWGKTGVAPAGQRQARLGHRQQCVFFAGSNFMPRN